MKRTLVNGVKIPMLGLGVFQTKEGKETEDAVRWALESGYRHIDTAKAYGNEKNVGEGIRQSGLERKDIFVTTKLWNEDIRKRNTRDAFFDSLNTMGLEYLDMYLIHWPAEGYEEAWKEMEKLYKEGYIRAIGVSNFQDYHLKRLMENAEIVPMVNQVECHPLMSQEPLRKFCVDHQIACEAWSPLGGTGGSLLQNKVLTEIAEKYEKTPAQVVIRWDLQNDIITIPKSVHKNRIESNREVFDFALSEEDIVKINHLNKNLRVGPSPDNFDF